MSLAANHVIVARVGEIPVGGKKKFSSGARRLLIVHCDDGYYATDDTCTHAESSLAEGTLSGCVIECALHGARFDVKTGEVLALPAFVPLRTYPVTVSGDEIQVDVA